jgi:hypothetical protein
LFAALSYELNKLNSVAHTGIVLLETGEGVKNAKRQLGSWLERHDARAVLSIGFAGGLSSSLQPGDIVVAREVTILYHNRIPACWQVHKSYRWIFQCASASRLHLTRYCGKRNLSGNLRNVECK